MNVRKYLTILPLLLLLASPSVADEEDGNTKMMRATVKISHDSSTATGFILSPREGDKSILITAAHVFEKTKGDETKIVYRMKLAEGEYKKEPTKLAIRKEGKPIWAQHPTEDIAAIWVSPPKNVDLASLSPELLASDERLKARRVHPGLNLNCLGYPHREESSKAGFPLLRHGPIATYPLLPTAKTKTFYLSANTFEGDSGGPVYLTRPSPTEPFLEEVTLIAGLVSAQLFLDEEMKMIYGTSKLRHRLGQAVVVHASFIRETIELLK